MSLLKKVMFGLSTLLSLAAMPLLAAESEYSTLNLRPGVTDNSQLVYDLHMEVVWLMFIVAALVFAAILYAVIRFRKSSHPTPAKFSHSTTLEIIWTVVPMLILIYLAKPAISLLLDIEDTSKADMTVQVTGIQWKWHYKYLDNGIEFESALSTPAEQYQDYERAGTDKGDNYLLEVDNEVVLPVGKKIRFLLTSRDVIHAWWMPDFAVKMDAIPGFINETWTKINEPGVYRGVCAELCGRLHGFMPIVVRALPQAEYDQWVATKLAEQEEARLAAERAAATSFTMEQLMEEGKKVYDAKCSMCHQPNGEGLGAAFPALAGSAVATTEPADDHTKLVIYGKNAMPQFGDSLTDLELAAVVTYERNAWGNDTGEIVQPARVAELKAGN
ncbi:MAG: cytochrome c oxidase subunit II [Kangiellaceae bacterium]|jgi:cytochrome c oxidase subunit 2|nr:cytochrome c oxidase subunit II [Kangiellaceae bacterium]